MDSYRIKEIQLQQVMPLIREQLAAGQSVRFSPMGTSMLPMLRQGMDAVVLSPLPPKLKKYDLPLYQRENGQFVLHRIVAVGDTYTCVGDNQFVRESMVTQEQMIALVTAFTRGKKTYHVQYLPYRLYCRFWHYSRPVRHLWQRGTGWLRRHLK